MIVLQITTRDSFSIVNLDHVVGIEYEQFNGELTLVGEATARAFFLDKGTDSNKVWDAIKMSLSPLYEPRSLQTHGVQLRLDLSQFQVNAKEAF